MSSMNFLRRNLLLIAIPALVVPALSIALVVRDRTTYEARAKLFFSRYQVASNVVSSESSTLDPVVEAQSQADLAQIPFVVRRTLRAGGLPSNDNAVASFLSENQAAAGDGLLTFIVKRDDPVEAQQLATAWARASLSARRSLDSRALGAALRHIRERLQDVRPVGGGTSPTYQSLVDKEVQLETLESLQFANGALVQPAPTAEKAGVGPVKTIAFA